MAEARSPIKLDFMSGLEQLPARPKADATTTLASVAAGREFGFAAKVEAQPARIDGRRLRSRGANTQLNLKVTAAEKETILEEASRHIQDPESRVSNIGEFVVMAVAFYRQHRGG